MIELLDEAEIVCAHCVWFSNLDITDMLATFVELPPFIRHRDR